VAHPNAGPFLIQLEFLTSSEGYPYGLPAFRDLRALAFHPKVTFLVGENGSGKSTLLEAIALHSDLNAEGGSRNFSFATRESHSDLDRATRMVRTLAFPKDAFFLRAESFYNVATEIERLGVNLEGYGGKSLHEQSHGESFCALFEHRFRGRGLYLLDEPEAALSPNRQLQFLSIMHDYCKCDSQFIIATHSPIIMAYPDAWIYELSEKGTRRIAYEETEHYRVTKSFLTHPKRMLSVLLGDEPESE